MSSRRPPAIRPTVHGREAPRKEQTSDPLKLVGYNSDEPTISSDALLETPPSCPSIAALDPHKDCRIGLVHPIRTKTFESDPSVTPASPRRATSVAFSLSINGARVERAMFLHHSFVGNETFISVIRPSNPALEI